MTAQPDATALARKFKVDVNTGSFAVPVWTSLKAITEWSPKIDPVYQEAGTYDDDGQEVSDKTGLKASAEVTFLRRKAGAGTYDPAQESIRAKLMLYGDDGKVELRWYDRDGGDEAFQCRFYPAWERANSGRVDLDAAKVTFTQAGICEAIANPA